MADIFGYEDKKPTPEPAPSWTDKEIILLAGCSVALGMLEAIDYYPNKEAVKKLKDTLKRAMGDPWAEIDLVNL